ncbi:zeaxanthin epoxidase [Klebsormidium nitens]|uniref:Zeaxanthin epoxidase n=1 Tax=Klebsormidium nitens TaxID=105231 RepID=A0A1Y1INK4_KLENI|nr:zeaxanthin epoxidase [Klebsormidium nitens]|eukprot:GAQ92475.1 zeaxanthin epoxidase [Klebsormidium nitens]
MQSVPLQTSHFLGQQRLVRTASLLRSSGGPGQSAGGHLAGVGINAAATAGRARVSMSSAVEKVDVAIIGGGPGGLATAKGITRACPELKVRVFERAKLRPRGASVFVMPNGMHALEALDPETHARVLAHHSPAGATVTRNMAGEVIGEAGGDSVAAPFASYGPCAYLLWASLQKALADSLPEGVLETEVRLGDSPPRDEGDHVRLQIVSAGRRPDGAAAKEIEARVVVGADGNQSQLRQHILGDGPSSSMGVGLFRALLPRPEKWIAPNSATIWAGPKQAFRTAVFQGDVATWTGIVPWPAEEEHLLQGRAYIAANDAGEGARFSPKERCLRAFEHWPDAVRGIIAATDADSILVHGQNYRDPDRCTVWGRGRATLVGDAAHLGTPLLGQGTSQALEDALELSRCIHAHGATSSALRAYERARQPLAQPIQAISVDLFKRFQAGESFPPDNEARLSIEHGFVARSFRPLPVA